jgi:TatD DNase family protein
MPYIDIGANLLDGMYEGSYGGSSQKHPPDLEGVLARAWGAGLSHIMITAGTLTEAREALELAKSDSRLFTTGELELSR